MSLLSDCTNCGHSRRRHDPHEPEDQSSVSCRKSISTITGYQTCGCRKFEDPSAALKEIIIEAFREIDGRKLSLEKRPKDA